MYSIIIIVSGFLPSPMVQHFIPPFTWCQLASLCNHTSVHKCGQIPINLNTRIFMDECDMFEYNCDNKKDYKEVDMIHCQQTTTTVETQISTSMSNIVTDLLTTIEVQKNISRVPIDTECTRNTKKTRSTTKSSSSTASTPFTSVLSTLSSLTTTTSSLKTTSTVTSANMTTRAQTGNSTISTSTKNRSQTTLDTDVTNCTRNPDQQKTSVLCTEKITEAVTTKYTEFLTTTATSNIEVEPTIITTTIYEELTNIVDYTDNNQNEIVTETETTLTYDETEKYEPKNNNDATNDMKDIEIPDEISNTTSNLVECGLYPKECNRPYTWETTSKGETRDFYQILKAKFGTRIRFLRATTHWPRRAQYFLTGDEGTFMFGRHNES